MAQTVPSPIQSNQFRPLRTGNPAVDDALRQSFDYHYQTRAQIEQMQAQIAALQTALKAAQKTP